MPPWYLLLPAGLCLLGMMLPLVYLVDRAFDADMMRLREIVWRQRTLMLLFNTLVLGVSVLAVVTALALPMAWLTTRSDLPGRRWFTLLAVMPLAVPAYIIAFTMLAMGGPHGIAAQRIGIEMPRIQGFAGALLALSLYNLPYMFLNLRVAMRRLNPAYEEAARSLGLTSIAVFRRVIIPQLLPAFCAGGLLVVLHVIADFGAVALFRYESFSYALYVQYNAGDPIYAAWLALMLVTLTVGLLIIELRFLRGLRLDPTGVAITRPKRPVKLGWWKLPAIGLFAGVTIAGLILPLLAIAALLWRHHEGWGIITHRLLPAATDSVSAALPAAIFATALAIPIAFMARRYPSTMSRGVEQFAYLGYAVPGLAFALGILFFTRTMPALSQTLMLLIAAYALHFLAEAIGPVRSALFVATPRLEEASRSLGHGRIKTFFKVTFPLLRSGLVVSMALVFLSAMKELPMAIILSPLGFQTLAHNLWDYTNEAMFAQAAPYALAILVCSTLFVGLLLLRGHEEPT